MTDLKSQRRMAAEVLNIGIHRVQINVQNPDSLKEIEQAITRADIRKLIKKGLISAKPVRGVSRARAKIIQKQKQKGRRKGHGRRSGSTNARLNSKEKWMNNIRALRRYLKKMRDSKEITVAQYRQLYGWATAGRFKSKSHLKLQVEKMKG